MSRASTGHANERSDRSVLVYCRPGFENECAAELDDVAGQLDVAGECDVAAQRGFVRWQAASESDALRFFNNVVFDALIFARAWFLVCARCTDLPAHNRVAPIVAHAAQCQLTASELVVATPDSDQTRPLAPLCRGIAAPLRQALTKANVLGANHGPRRLHVCFVATDEALVGWDDPANSSPWPGGIPRLRSSQHAPSRSAMKLEEALVQFAVGEKLKPGMTAVDLGAAPGGWTWILTQHHLRVIAVDNAALNRSLLDTGLVEHRREDGFRYKPNRPVDWMVCDMVEKPGRVASLVAQWLTQRWCTRVIANLKLPMKKRYEHAIECLEHIHESVSAAGIKIDLRAKQLYHDREEITLYAATSPQRNAPRRR